MVFRVGDLVAWLNLTGRVVQVWETPAADGVTVDCAGRLYHLSTWVSRHAAPGQPVTKLTKIGDSSSSSSVSSIPSYRGPDDERIEFEPDFEDLRRADRNEEPIESCSDEGECDMEGK